METVKDQGLKGSAEQEESPKDCKDSEKLWGTTVVDTRHYTFVRAPNPYDTKNREWTLM